MEQQQQERLFGKTIRDLDLLSNEYDCELFQIAIQIESEC